MGKIFKVLRREYSVIVWTKGFLISTLLVPLIMIILVILPIISSQVKSEKQKKISVIDETGLIFDELNNNINEQYNKEEKTFLLTKIDTDSDNLKNIEKTLQSKILKNQIDGYIHISKNIFENNKVFYYASNVTNFTLNNIISQALNKAITKQRILKEGFEPSIVMKLTQRINFEPIRISKDEKKQGGGQTFLVAYILMFALYMTIIIYGTSVMRSVTEEKSSRVVEVLLSSLKPFELMAGKILGVSLVGLTQYFIWAIFAISIFSFGQIILGSFLKSSFNISSIPFISPTIFVYFILFFILGYLLYSGLYAAVGAIVDNESEARSYNFIILMPLILPILIMTYIVGNPESLFSIILSIIPFTSPIIMLLRICVSSVPAFEILISVIVMILTIIAEIWVVSKIYRVGILMYGKKPDIREILKWIRYS